jgi:histidinol-phosphate/aromatic aminotransferase/cobyric acid decarboxylase-like protein
LRLRAEAPRRIIFAQPCAAAADAVFVVDEAYADFGGDTLIPQVRATPGLFVMRSLSKVGLAGLRIGALIGPADCATSRASTSTQARPTFCRFAHTWMPPGPLGGCLRMTVGTALENERCTRALRQILGGGQRLARPSQQQRR